MFHLGVGLYPKSKTKPNYNFGSVFLFLNSKPNWFDLVIFGVVFVFFLELIKKIIKLQKKIPSGYHLSFVIFEWVQKNAFSDSFDTSWEFYSKHNDII